MTRSHSALLSTLAALGILTVSACTAGEGASASPEGVWGDPATSTAASLEFEGGTSGEYHGTDGCNRINGAYVQDESGVVDLGEMRTTLMLCEDIDEWLAQARTATIADDTMTFLDEEGTQLGSLERASG